MFIALIREVVDSLYQINQVKSQIVVQFGSPEDLQIQEHIVNGFDPERFERELAESLEDDDSWVAVVCMGKRATEALTGFSPAVGTIAKHRVGKSRQVLVLSTFRVADLEENVNRLNLVKVHLHRLAVAAGLIERS